MGFQLNSSDIINPAQVTWPLPNLGNGSST